MNLIIAVLLIATSAFAQIKPGFLSDYNYQVTDIATKGLKKEVLFSELYRETNPKGICAYKAHMWSWQMSRKHKIQTGKIFMFFTYDVWAGEKKKYWYHVAPYIVENGVEYVMEGSYPGEFDEPLTVKDWIEQETDGRYKFERCKEITAADKDLTENFIPRSYLPDERPNRRGAPCYYRKVPEALIAPNSIAYFDYGVDENEEKISKKDFSLVLTTKDREEVYGDCMEVSYGGRKVCEKISGM